jgi:hypothetical protein
VLKALKVCLPCTLPSGNQCKVVFTKAKREPRRRRTRDRRRPPSRREKARVLVQELGPRHGGLQVQTRADGKALENSPRKTRSTENLVCLNFLRRGLGDCQSLELN